MEGYVLEWLSLLGRWVHLIVGIAWIGASFYFVWLDNHLVAPEDPALEERGVSGELWAVHGGGFYNAQKYKVAPESLPPTLHWFKWEAYTTWITGMFLMALIYWYQAEIYLIDPQVLAISKPIAVVLGIATLIIGWVAYDRLCRSRIGQNEGQMAVIMLVLLTIAAWGLCQLFSGRGAFMHFGAMLGTIMVGNVLMVIMPGQRALVAAKEQGNAPDAIHGIRGKQRSVHNTYFTLPVLLVMISNHYAMLWGHAWNWLILIALSLAGALIRVHFVKRHFGTPSPVPMTVAVGLLVAIIVALVPATPSSSDAASHSAGSAVSSTVPTLADAHVVVTARCSTCHANNPSHPGFSAPPKGVAFDTEDKTLAQAAAIYQQTVVTKAMPMGNLTLITDEERALLGQWFQSLDKD